jgi:Holliday junction resolvase RusA-like endonuclease
MTARMTTEQAMQNPVIRAALTRQVQGKPPEFLPATVYAFNVDGEPVPEGSMVAFWSQNANRCIVKADDPRLDAWRKQVNAAARTFMAGRSPIGAYKPVLLGCEFRLSREVLNKHGKPAAGNSINAGSEWPVFKRDEDKLVRAVRDGLTGVLVEDDGQIVGSSITDPVGKVVVALPAFKRFARPGERPGVIVRVALVASAQRALLAE